MESSELASVCAEAPQPTALPLPGDWGGRPCERQRPTQSDRKENDLHCMDLAYTASSPPIVGRPYLADIARAWEAPSGHAPLAPP